MSNTIARLDTGAPRETPHTTVARLIRLAEYGVSDGVRAEARAGLGVVVEMHGALTQLPVEPRECSRELTYTSNNSKTLAEDVATFYGLATRNLATSKRLRIEGPEALCEAAVRTYDRHLVRLREALARAVSIYSAENFDATELRVPVHAEVRVTSARRALPGR